MKSNSLLGRAFRMTFLCAIVGMFSGWANANNIRIIGKPVLKEQDTLNHTVLIKFDIAWDNSWKTSKPENHDAAWIFVKCWDGESWNHVYLENEGNVAGSKNAADAVNKDVTYYVANKDESATKQDMVLKAGYSYAWKKWHLDPEEDSVQCIVGFFLYRKDYGAGHVVVPGVTFKWNYGEQGFVDEDDLVVKVFAVEMVYVPTGAYYLGGRGTAAWQKYSFTTNGNVFGSPMVITSEDAITVENSAGSSTLFAIGNGMTEGTIPAEFPKGYDAFYIMKYEMTQEAYCEFLNTLNQGQQDNRVQGVLNNLGVNAFAWGGDVSVYRNGIKVMQAAPVVIFGCDGNFNNKYNETDQVCYDGGTDTAGNCLGRTLTRNIDGQDIAVNFVSFFDLLAYAEFSGLRPMTELEYEKACRGPREPVNDEYAWGSVTMTFWYANHIGYVDYRTGTERPNGVFNSGAAVTISSCWWSITCAQGPVRVGCFADSTTTRAAAGATFWGVMNMSDNVAEMCISASYDEGRSFVGSHGCGQLDGNGSAINTDWWDLTTNWKYYIPRGMYFVNGNLGTPNTNDHYWAGMVSSRFRFNHSIPGDNRDYTGNGMRGIRCVRTEDTQK